MKALKMAIWAAAALGVLSCGGAEKARIYRMALDTAPIDDAPTSCYDGAAAPTTKTVRDNVTKESTWTFWDGADGTVYLDASSFFPLPVGNVTFVDPSVIGGKDKTFSATITSSGEQQSTGSSYTRTMQYEVKLTQTGDVLKGNLTLHYTYSSVNPAPGTKVTDCSVAIPFVGRLMEHEPQSGV